MFSFFILRILPTCARRSWKTKPTTTMNCSKMGVDVYSISTDSHFCHKAWHESSAAVGKINFKMISDNTFEISESFNVLREKEGRSERGTFLVDPDGKIKFMEVSCEGVGRDASSLVRKVKAAQYVREHPDEVCPAKGRKAKPHLRLR